MQCFLVSCLGNKSLSYLMSCICFETVLNEFVSKYVVTQNIFSLLSKVLWSGIKIVKVYYFQIWNQKEHNIIISSYLQSHRSHEYRGTLLTVIP